MADVQLAFYRQTLRLKKAVPGHLILAELDEVPWVGSWWSQILGFLHKLGNLAGDALHAEILRDNVHDAQMDPSCGNWAAGVDKMYSSLGMQSLFLGPAGVGARAGQPRQNPRGWLPGPGIAKGHARGPPAFCL